MPVLAMLIQQAGSARLWVTGEFVVYALPATTLLRCLRIAGPPFDSPDDGDAEHLYWHSEALVRRTIYQMVQFAVVWLTLILALTVAL